MSALLIARCSCCLQAISLDAPVRTYVDGHAFHFCSLHCLKRWCEVSDLSRLPTPPKLELVEDPARYSQPRPTKVGTKVETKVVNLKVVTAPRPRMSPEAYVAMVAARNAKIRAAWQSKSKAERRRHTAKARATRRAA